MMKNKPTGDFQMNRVIAAVAGLATATAATTVFATAVGPAMAATRPAATHPAAHAKAPTGKPGAVPAMRHLKSAPAAPTEIASEVEGGKYVTVVKCSGGMPPKPIRLAARDIPLTVHGTGSSPAIAAKLAKPNRYKTLYTCTVTVRLQAPLTKIAVKKPSISVNCKVCTKIVTLNTGFGGLAGQVSKHHPGK
jgi:hypothetical protein